MSRFNKFKIVDEAGLVTDSKKMESKFFETGLHNAKIVSIEDLGPNKKDPSWYTYKIVFEGVGGKSITKWLLVPTENEYFAEPGKLGVFHALVHFLEALVPFKDGKTPVTSANAGMYIQKYFENPDKDLKGKNVEIRVGFSKHHAQYLEKDLYELQTKDGQAVLEDGEPVRANTYGAIEQQALKMGLPYNNFREILGFGVPQSNAKSPTKIVPKVEEDEDTIF